MRSQSESTWTTPFPTCGSEGWVPSHGPHDCPI
nr:unnamed protein product [Callosobruchus chinensis]